MKTLQKFQHWSKCKDIDKKIDENYIEIPVFDQISAQNTGLDHTTADVSKQQAKSSG